MIPTDKLYNNDSTKKGTSLCMISPITTVVDNDKEDSWSVSSKESSIEEEEQGELKRPAQPWNQPLFIISSSKQSIFKTCYRRSYVRQKQSDSVIWKYDSTIEYIDWSAGNTSVRVEGKNNLLSRYLKYYNKKGIDEQ